MTRTEFAELVRENTSAPRLDVRPLRGPLYLIGGAILLLALLLLPVSILAVELIYAQVLVKQTLDEMKTKAPGRSELVR